MHTNQSSTRKPGLFSALAVRLIGFYQKFISPFKGFSCAHRYRHGGPSCSEYVRQVVQRDGIVAGSAEIRSRFRACRSAALALQHRYPQGQAGFVDCSFDGCGDIGSCFDGFGSDGGGGGKSTTVIILPGLLLLVILLLAGFVWLQPAQVSAIDIRLIDSQQEVEEQGIARLIGGELPDYQVVFVVRGKNITTNTLANSSAEHWLSLQPKRGFAIEDLQQIRILNKQVLQDEVLDVIDDPGVTGRGELYEYRLTED